MGGGTPLGRSTRSSLSGPSPRGRGNRDLGERAEHNDGTIPAWAGEPNKPITNAWVPRDHPRVGGGTLQCTWKLIVASGPSPRGRGNHPIDRKAQGRLGTIPAWAGEPRIDLPSPARLRDHPRVGGGTIRLHHVAGLDQGPSPRGRGNLDLQSLRIGGRGTIPAWAGEPWCRPHGSRAGRDHPRVGGGTGSMITAMFGVQGPSPRGRGNRGRGGERQSHLGTIPAWAGEPSSLRVGMIPPGDHPRVGGGTCRATRLRRPPVGPSPRGRGNHQRDPARRHSDGTIPAWAGEPSGAPTGRIRRGDHPRVGGGTIGNNRSKIRDEGPSPRGRGNPSVVGSKAAASGTIPAWAGEPRRVVMRNSYVRDHPRVGGGTHEGAPPPKDVKGPSPRGRGNPQVPVIAALDPGTIPAWAGEPRPSGLPCAGCRDHPRVGGGTQCRAERDRPVWGPSPRGRGNLGQRRAEAQQPGTIPAWAGEPLPVA